MTGGCRRLGAVLLAMALACVAPAQAQITLDGSLGRSGGLSGPDYLIGADLGRQVGGNLFHSFGRFNLLTGESATFSGPGSVSNIIGRVTGGSASSIDGTIRSTIPGANLFLVNPAGMMFGPNASLDVQGSFHATTADYLRLADGARFQATNPTASSFTAAPPVAFGFLGPNPAALTVQGSFLAVPSGASLSLVGGPVTIANGLIQAPGGTVNIASARNPGESAVDQAQVVNPVLPDGVVSITTGSTIDVGDVTGILPAGTIRIRGGAITMDASTAQAKNTGSSPAGGIVIESDGSVMLSGGTQILSSSTGGNGGAITIRAGSLILESAVITADTQANGTGGAISVDAGTVMLRDGGQIRANTSGTGNGGTVLVRAKQLTIDGQDALILTNAFDQGNAGDVTIEASTVTVRGGGAIGSVTLDLGANFQGNAGNVTLKADQLTILDGGSIVSNTTGGSGNAGAVNVHASQVTIDGTNANGGFTGISSNSQPGGGSGNAGAITLEADAVSIRASGEITSSTFTFGNSGSVMVRAGQLTIDGANQTPHLFTGIATDARSSSSGNAGRITVDAGKLTLLNNGIITSGTFSSGNAGSVAVRADRLTIDGAHGIVNLTTGIISEAAASASGNAGQVTIDAGELNLLGNGAISGGTFGSGNGGAVTVRARQLTIDGTNGDPRFLTGIASQTEPASSGNAGQVTVEANAVRLIGGGRISSSALGRGRGGDVVIRVQGEMDASGSDAGGRGSGVSVRSTGQGDAGTISVQADKVVLQNGGGIFATAAQAGGGNVDLRLGHLLFIDHGTISTSVSGISGNGGNVTIDPQAIVLRASTIRANAVGGNGGNLRLASDVFLADPSSLLSASSTLGISGTIVVSAPHVDVTSAIAIKAPDFFDAASLISEGCSGRSGSPRSSLIVSGRGGLPADAETSLSAFYRGHEATSAAGQATGRNGMIAEVSTSPPNGSAVRSLVACGSAAVNTLR
ncbi:MAG: filamentous hemagglutinin N-terminal domain-containing protein [Proteobacteria bacterium]|nr:filamentous hemagglutinin N-terminal domain-containing protein [Pseudomonadota bacterium]MBI3495928.1 filamentous hemagglutinin N-terminal domain-containing protein [Pseudomonadota bacterium]